MAVSDRAGAKRIVNFTSRARGVLRSPALGAAVALTAGGVGFAIGNILLARVMETEQFGQLTLFLALTQLVLSIGPLGLETTINRHQLDASPALFAHAFTVSLAIGTGFAVVAAMFYRMGFALSFWLVPAAAGASINRIGAAFLQSHGRFRGSLGLLQIHNFVLVAAVALLLALGRDDALPAVALIATGYVVTSLIGWRSGWRLPRRPVPSVGQRALFKEGLTAAGIGFATQLLWQLERLVIPRTLTVADLATFAVLAAIAGSPFRMMQTGIGYTLLPGLRACRDRRATRRLLLREGTAICIVAAGATALIFVLVPFVMERFLHGRYTFSMPLLSAIVIVGIVKLWNGFAAAIVPALGTARDMAVLNLGGWVAVAIGAVCAFAGSRFGLLGIVYGVGCSWLALAVLGTMLATRALRTARYTAVNPEATE